MQKQYSDADSGHLVSDPCTKSGEELAPLAENLPLHMQCWLLLLDI